MAISKNDYGILFALFSNQCTTKMKSFTINKICENANLSKDKVRLTIKTFKLLKYVDEGAPAGHAKTYYITPVGIKNINKLIGEELK